MEEDNGNQKEAQGNQEEEPDMAETERFLGANPKKQQQDEFVIMPGISDRINAWIKSGLTDKDEKDRLLKDFPRSGQISVEAYELNEEIAVDLNPRSLTRDNHFKEYQNLVGTALAGTSAALSMIMENKNVDRDFLLANLSDSVMALSECFHSLTQARKTFVLGGYEEKIQKRLKKIEPTSLLFGDNLKNTIENTKAMEKVAKELRAKPKAPFVKRNNNGSSLNWKSSSFRKEGERGGYKAYQGRLNPSRSANNSSKSNSHPAKKYYPQSQPQRSRR